MTAMSPAASAAGSAGPERDGAGRPEGPGARWGRVRERAPWLALATILIVGAVFANVLAAQLATGVLAVPVRVAVGDGAAAAAGLRVAARTHRDRFDTLRYTGAAFETDAYVNRIYLHPGSASIAEVGPVVISIGDAAFRFERGQVAATWSRKQVPELGGEVWVSPPSVRATRSRVAAIRASVLNWRGDDAAVAIAIPILLRTAVFGALLLALAVCAYVFFDRNRLRATAESRWWVAAAAAIPFAMVWFVRAYHVGDVSAYDAWGACWGRGPASIYVACQTGEIAYPFLGNLVSAGPLAVLARAFPDAAQRHLLFRVFLAAFDAGAALAAWRLLKALSVPGAPAWTFGLAAIPSAWAGSSVWGQIDGVGQLVLLLAMHAFLIALRSEREPWWRGTAWFTAGMVGIAALLLLKQLLLFAALSLGLLAVVVGAANVAAQGRRGAWRLLAGAAAFLFALFVWDAYLDVPHPFRSHLGFAWLGTGGAPGFKLSAHGMNVWALTGAPVWSSGLISLSGAFVPVLAGQTLLVAFVGWAAWVLLGRSASALPALLERLGTDREAAVRFFSRFMLFFALVQLAMNVLLTGIHERYLFHFYPFVLVALLAGRVRGTRFDGALLVSVIGGSIAYGLFVLNCVLPLPRALFAVTNQAALATVHLLLLVQLSRQYARA